MKAIICVFIMIFGWTTSSIAQQKAIMQSDAFAYSFHDEENDVWTEYTDWNPSEIQIDIEGNTYVIHASTLYTFTITENFPEHIDDDGTIVMVSNTVDMEGISNQIAFMICPGQPYGYLQVTYRDSRILYRLIKE